MMRREQRIRSRLHLASESSLIAFGLVNLVRIQMHTKPKMIRTNNSWCVGDGHTVVDRGGVVADGRHDGGVVHNWCGNRW